MSEWERIIDRGFGAALRNVFVCSPCECGGMCDKCGQTEREARGVAQVPGQDAHGVAESTGLEPRRTENAGVIAPPAGLGTAVRADASLSVCLCDPDTDAVCDRNCP